MKRLLHSIAALLFLTALLPAADRVPWPHYDVNPTPPWSLQPYYPTPLPAPVYREVLGEDWGPARLYQRADGLRFYGQEIDTRYYSPVNGWTRSTRMEVIHYPQSYHFNVYRGW